MVLYSADYREIARECLKGNWIKAIIAFIIAALLGAFSVKITAWIRFVAAAAGGVEYFGDVQEYFNYLLAGASGFTLLQVFVGETIKLGYIRFNLSILDQEEVRLRSLFSCFGSFWKAFIMRFAVVVLVCFFTLFLIIPGIIAALTWSMAPYILEEKPDFTVREVLRASRKIMERNKFKLLKLKLSFIGWDLLTLFTLGVAGIYVIPYKNTAEAVFYNEISGRADVFYGREELLDGNN